MFVAFSSLLFHIFFIFHSEIQYLFCSFCFSNYLCCIVVGLFYHSFFWFLFMFAAGVRLRVKECENLQIHRNIFFWHFFHRFWSFSSTYFCFFILKYIWCNGVRLGFKTCENLQSESKISFSIIFLMFLFFNVFFRVWKISVCLGKIEGQEPRKFANGLKHDNFPLFRFFFLIFFWCNAVRLGVKKCENLPIQRNIIFCVVFRLWIFLVYWDKIEGQKKRKFAIFRNILVSSSFSLCFFHFWIFSVYWVWQLGCQEMRNVANFAKSYHLFMMSYHFSCFDYLFDCFISY